MSEHHGALVWTLIIYVGPEYCFHGGNVGWICEGLLYTHISPYTSLWVCLSEPVFLTYQEIAIKNKVLPIVMFPSTLYKGGSVRQEPAELRLDNVTIDDLMTP